MSAAVRAGYKLTEVGVIPEDWEPISIGEIATVDGGYAFSSKYFLSQGAYQIVKMSNLYGGTLDLDRSTSFLNELDDLQRRYLLKKDDILLTLTGTTGKRDFGFSFRLTEQRNLLLNQRVARLVAHANTDAGYLAYQLAAPTFQNQFFDISKGGTGNQTNVGTSDVAAMFLPYPPIAEQRAIATALSDVDALLAKLDALIAKKRDLKVATMQQLLTGQTRLPGFSGEWEVRRLGDLATLKNGYTFKSDTYTSLGSYKVITIANVQDGYMVTEGCNAVDRTPSDIQPHQLLKIGDILISMTGNVGRVCRVCEDRCLLNQRVGKLVPTVVNDAFLFALLRQPSFIVAMSGAAKGGAQPNLSASDITEHEICIPSDSVEQTAIAAALVDMDTELTALEARRDKTRALKQGMMQELLTGRIRLS